MQVAIKIIIKFTDKGGFINPDFLLLPRVFYLCNQLKVRWKIIIHRKSQNYIIYKNIQYRISSTIDTKYVIPLLFFVQQQPK